MTKIHLTPAPLTDPLYYLHNARLVIDWCLNHHCDLLLPQEASALGKVLSLDTQSQALLIRLVMRKGDLFRLYALNYAEIDDLGAAIEGLTTAELVDISPALSLVDICNLFRREECLAFARQYLPDSVFSASTSKAVLVDALSKNSNPSDHLQLNEWWPEAPCQVIRLNCMSLFDLLRLMFFGNLRQDWSEFVLTELGLQQYQSVPLNAKSRAFRSRDELDHYLSIHQLQLRLAEGESVAALIESLPGPIESPWLDNRRQHFLFLLGREAERQNSIDQALFLYSLSQHREALVRELRLMEKLEKPAEVFALAQRALKQIEHPETRISLERICRRSARKADLSYPARVRINLPTENLVLTRPAEGGVEQSVIRHLTKETGQAFHVENSLFNGLFALLFWPALFAPVRGAFFNPFQDGPADLYRPEFAEHRRLQIENSFASIEDGSYRKRIMDRLRSKQGINCSLIHWPTLEEAFVEQVLELIPPSHLRVIFHHLLLDLRHHRRGMPDLIYLNPLLGEYRLIEVKGPGDRLQDHQRLWLEFFVTQQIPVRLCHVEWNESQ